MSEASPLPEGLRERRNPIGWILIAFLVLFMITNQLSSYLGRKPSTELQQATITEQLQTMIGLESIQGSGANQQKLRDRLGVDTLALKPGIAKDPKAALLFAAIRTELGQPVVEADIASLKTAKGDSYRAAYEIYSLPKLDAGEAASLAKRIPDTGFLNKLVAAQAFQKAGDTGPRKALAQDSGFITKLLVNVAIIGFGVLGIFVIGVYAIVRAGGNLTPKGLALGELSLPNADRVAMRCAQLFCTFLGVALFGGLLFSGLVPKDFIELPIYICIVGIVVYLAQTPVAGRSFSLRMLGITSENLGKNIVWGLSGAIANIPILILVQMASLYVFKGLPPPEHPVTVELTDTTSPLVILQLVVIASVLAPFIEEIMFRGTLFPALSAVLKSPFWAGLVSSLIFASIHPTGIPAWPGLAAIGGMSCFLAYQTKSLVPSIVMHAANNFGVLVFTLIALK